MTVLVLTTAVGDGDAGGLQLIHIDTPEAEEKQQAPVHLQQGRDDGLEDLLHASIRYSDPERMKELAEEYKKSGKTIADVLGEDFLKNFLTDPSVIMQNIVNEALVDVPANRTVEERVNLLEQLVDLVSQVDNAMNLNKMGGLRPLVHLFAGDGGNATASERTAAGWALGTALSNNEGVQSILLEEFPDALDVMFKTLNESVNNDEPGLAAKSAFCLSALIRNNFALQEAAGESSQLRLLVDNFDRYGPAVGSKIATLLTTVIRQQQDNNTHDNATLARWIGSDKLRATVPGISEQQFVSEDRGGYSLDQAARVIQFLDAASELEGEQRTDEFQSSVGELRAKWKKWCQEEMGSDDKWCSQFDGNENAQKAASNTDKDEL
ncbi:hsp70 nucleotide exchange factor fes1 [Perkinsus chesapeaki]|uniref:Hsp70 nucleotide exchange factor fes1 n=1 Tax=Perkinsus chesapeaki TaxID=330153 RepID=A0A7J6M0T4_PERCH|nr:hsp70 nucleotide exchange factor fes1 [Perkinsus chesapeaki]